MSTLQFRWLTVLCAMFSVCCISTINAAALQKPNIVFIMADDLGFGDLGCYGQKYIETPNVDRLAGQGMRFTQFYSGAPVCAPARCTLMTGVHLGHARVRNNYEESKGKWDSFGGQYPLLPDAVTVAKLLKKAGYATGAFGKWGLGGVGTTGDPLKQGFDRFFGYNCQRHAHNLFPRYLVDNDKQRFLPGNDRGLTGKTYGPQAVADELLQFIRNNKDRPFFAYYPTVIPHLALQVPEKDLVQYKGRWPETPYAGKEYLPHPTPRACYAAMVSFMDRQVGRVMDLLTELGLEENTIVFFTSDNGVTHLGDEVDYKFFGSAGPFRGLKGDVYEGGLRIPLIVRWPGRIAEGAVSGHVAAHYDMMSTLCNIAGITPPPHTDGISVLPTLQGRADRQRQHDFLLWEFYGYGGQQAVRMGDWKAVRRDCQKNPDGPIELYNLRTDIGETRDLSGQYPNLVLQAAEIMTREHTPSEEWDFRKSRTED